MRITITVILLLCFYFTHAGENFDFVAYNNFARRAELAITDDNYKQAMSFYDSAFTLKERPFAKDLYNAGICAIKTGEKSKAVVYCQQLADKGVGAAFFDKPIYGVLRREKKWKALLIKADLAKRQFYEKNKGLLKTLDSMADKDQLVNHQWRQSGMASQERQMMDLTYDTLSRDLKHLLDSIGFISEDMIGVKLTESNMLSRQLPYEIIIIHNYQARKVGDTLFRSILYDAMRTGKIKPEVLAGIEDFASNNIGRAEYGTAHMYVQYKCSLYSEKYGKEQLDAIEKARASIGLGKKEDDLKRILYKIQHPGTEFLIRMSLSKYMSFADEESEKMMLADGELIIKEIPGCKE